MSDIFQGRLGLQQRVVPSYRAEFLEALGKVCKGGLSVFAGKPLLREGIKTAEHLRSARLIEARNRYLFDPSSPLFLCWQSDFINWLEDWQPDVLIVEANPRYRTTHKAISWMHHKGRKVVGWGLGAPAIEGPLAGTRKRERASLLQSLDAIIAYSQQGAEQYRKLGFPAKWVYVASNAVAPAPTSLPSQKPAQVDGRLTVLFVGRLQQRKRVDILLRACNALPQETQPDLVIVGDGPARSVLTELAQQIYPTAQFIGAKHGEDLEAYFRKADLFVLPGTGGLAVQQAMAHGLPVIVAKGDGTQEDLVRSENGWLVPADDMQALVETLRLALTEPEKLRKMGEASFGIVAEEINVERMVEVFLQVLRDIHQGEEQSPEKQG